MSKNVTVFVSDEDFVDQVVILDIGIGSEFHNWHIPNFIWLYLLYDFLSWCVYLHL